MAPHFPLDVPKGFEDSVELADDDRRKFAGMMAALDDGVGNITRALKDNNMWEDTLFVFLSDNGGDAAFAGSNYPFRGNKATLWEGGVKVPAFIHGSMLKQSGYVNKELYHFTDVFATLLKVAGGEPDDDIDGKNQWDSLCRGEHSERSEMLLHLDTHPVTNGAALRSGDYKYIEGITNLVVQKLNQNDELHFDQWYRPAESPDAEIPDAPLISENVNNRFLFNLKDDPLETTNLFNDPDKQDIINEMKQRLDEYRASLPQFWFPPGFDERGNPDNFGEAWTPGWC
ncbi:arylsulfatase B-like [Saccoglossus kowalevskii]